MPCRLSLVALSWTLRRLLPLTDYKTIHLETNQTRLENQLSAFQQTTTLTLTMTCPEVNVICKPELALRFKHLQQIS